MWEAYVGGSQIDSDPGKVLKDPIQKITIAKNGLVVWLKQQNASKHKSLSLNPSTKKTHKLRLMDFHVVF
jgi:hypothetical protein